MRRLAVFLAVCAGAMALAVPAARSAAPRPLSIYFVDVEGGAATLAVTPAGESILVDCGWPGLEDRDPLRIQRVAKIAGITQIDHYVTTHWHTDHYGGIAGLTRLVPVRNFWDRGIPDTLAEDPGGFQKLMAAYKQACGGRSHMLSPGDTIPLRTAGQPLELKVLAARGKVLGEGDPELPTACEKHPGKPIDTSDNAKSLALLLTAGRFHFLNCGDLTWNIEHKLACPQNRAGKVDLWQVTHHGSNLSNNPALAEAIEPRCAVMVNGPRKGGDPETVRLLKRLPSLQAFYQLHRKVTSGPEDNAPPDRIANPEESCRGEFIAVRLSDNGDTYSVYKGADMNWGTYRVR